jgi:hypothetical protein
MAERTRVFISYSHDSPEHERRVLDLADALRDGGLDVLLDQYVHPAPDEGWPRWMENRLDEANFVLMVCAETYRRRVMGKEQPGKGLGVRWEGNSIYNRIYNDPPSGSRFIPVLLERSEPAQTPTPVQGHTHYRIRQFDLSDPGYEGLYRHLTGQAPTPPREVGAISTLPPRPRSQPPDPRNRTKMLEKVRKIWITGFLEKSLTHEARILLGLGERPDAVARPMDLLVQRPDRGERPLQPGVPIVKVFDDAMGQLLILGAPGSGKTTLLLELARDLLDRAAQDPEHPIPVVFPLSTWAESRKPLAGWLVDELHLRYDVPRTIGQAWVEADQVLPLLDGLDEVKAEHLAACVEAINAYRRDRGSFDHPLAICSRMDGYKAQARPLRLLGAIVVQPLTPPQVESYLTEIGPAGEAVRRAIREDESLRELLDTPLMLDITTVAYAGRPDLTPPMSGTPEERRDDLFGAYVDQMFRRRGVESRYTPAQTVHWLSCLAYQMASHSQTIFYLERLQFDWLPQRQLRTIRGCYRLVFGLAFGLVGGLGFGLLTGLAGGLADGLVGGLVVGLTFWLGLGLSGGVAGRPFDPLAVITCTDTVHWSWARFREGLRRGLFGGLVERAGSGLVYGLLGGLFFGLVVGLFGLLGFGLFGGLGVGLAFGLGLGLVAELAGRLDDGLSGGLYNAFSLSEVETRAVPNQGIHHSARNALSVGLFVGLVVWVALGLFFGLVLVVFGLVSGLGKGPGFGLAIGLVFGLVVGLVGGLWAGGEACLKHLLLRLWLVRNGCTPWNYVKFLDHAAGRILLRKVGGGYIFIHRMLLEYFAARYDESAVEAAPDAEPSRIAAAM